MACNVLMCR